jgi:hypothetical protein
MKSLDESDWDLPLHKQFHYNEICNEIDRCSDIEQLKQIAKKSTLLHFQTQQAFIALMKGTT